jgi:hypothetical protein
MGVLATKFESGTVKGGELRIMEEEVMLAGEVILALIGRSRGVRGCLVGWISDLERLPSQHVSNG